MCGLVGWIASEHGSNAYDKRKFIDQALILDTVRGGDSTGVFTVPHKFKEGVTPYAEWRKQLSGGHEFVISPEYKQLFDAGRITDYKYCVGHNRSATVGGVNIDAAHPFTEGPITLVHNGTVKKEYTNEVDLANDSHGICWKLSKEDPEKVIKELDGAFALIWHDARDDSLNIVRNKERPFHMAKAAGDDTIYFASEAEMLYWLNKRLSLKLQEIVSLKPAHWLKFEPGKLMVPTVKEVELYSPPKGQYSGRASRYMASQWSGTGNKGVGHVMGSPSTPIHSSKMIGSGTKKRPVPARLEDDLLNYGLFTDQEEEFIPLIETTFKDSTIMGWLMPTDDVYSPIPAIIHGVNINTFKSVGNRVWTVQPLGIYNLSWALPMVVCRLRTTFDLENRIRQVPGNVPLLDKDTTYRPRMAWGNVQEVPKSPADIDLDEDDEDDPVEYPGPNGRTLNRLEWYVQTAGGCVDCGADLSIAEDAWGLEWINTDIGSRAMCATCVANQTHLNHMLSIKKEAS